MLLIGLFLKSSKQDYACRRKTRLKRPNKEESSFSIIDNRSSGTKKRATTPTSRKVHVQSTQKSHQDQSSQHRYGPNYKRHRARNAFISTGAADWTVLNEIEFSSLNKLTHETPQAITIASYGSVNYLNKAYDRVNTKNEKMLTHIERAKYSKTTSADPIIQQYIKENRATVFATDDILSLLMCATRTVYPWDIVVNKTADGKVILDKRAGGVFDVVTVNENSEKMPSENEKRKLNSWSAACDEAKYINQQFSRQVLEADRVQFEHPSPFDTSETEEESASCGYRYRKFDLCSSEDRVQLIVRTEVDAAVKTAQGISYVTVRALNERVSGGVLPWRKSLDSQPGTVVVTEMRNNSAKLARWTVQAILADAEQLKIGYVARHHLEKNSRHVILGTQAYKPRDFAAQMNLSLANGWGIVKAIVDLCLQLPEGFHVIMKDPNKPIIRVYHVPSDQDKND